MQTQREDRHVKMEAEIEAMLPQSREHQEFRELPEIREDRVLTPWFQMPSFQY